MFYIVARIKNMDTMETEVLMGNGTWSEDRNDAYHFKTLSEAKWFAKNPKNRNPIIPKQPPYVVKWNANGTTKKVVL